MKDWATNHPKARAMARRRREILDAAKACFIRAGYAGTSMEAIAEAAGISLMTLYRHAESKDDLFAATIGDACRARDETERAYFEGLLHLPLHDLLVTSARHMRAKIMHADTIALMRLVIAEAASFPHLLPLAYDGFIAHFEQLAAEVMQGKVDVPPELAARAARVFIDCLLGMDVLRDLLGGHQQDRKGEAAMVALAADAALAALGLVDSADRQSRAEVRTGQGGAS